MPRKKSDPAAWLPDPRKPDNQCNVFEAWSRYYQRIQKFRNFSENTVYEYTTALTQLDQVLAEEKPISDMNEWDVWCVATSNRYRKDGRPYATNTITKRFSVLHDIFMFLEARGVCADPMTIPPWKLVFPDGTIPNYELSVGELKKLLVDEYNARSSGKDKHLPRELPENVERKLVKMIMNNLQSVDEPWFALAVHLYTIIRISELCALNLGNFVAFCNPERKYRSFIDIGHSTDYRTGAAKNHMKTPNAPRRIPEHVELHSIRMKYMMCLSKALTDTDTDHLPVACMGDPSTRCVPARYSKFARSILAKILGSESIRDLALGEYAQEINQEEETHRKSSSADAEDFGTIETRILRRNSFTKFTTETMLDAEVIRAYGGHEFSKDDRRYKYVYSEDDLWENLHKVDKRVILTELHEELSTF